MFLPPTVPGRNITTQNGGMLSDTSFTVTVNLPITEYPPDQLHIIVSLIPNDTVPVVVDFPASYQYTVMFSDLMAGTSYIYTVRVVRRSDMTSVVEPFEGSIIVLCKFLCVQNSHFVIANKGAPKEYTRHQFPAIKH